MCSIDHNGVSVLQDVGARATILRNFHATAHTAAPPAYRQSPRLMASKLLIHSQIIVTGICIMSMKLEISYFLRSILQYSFAAPHLPHRPSPATKKRTGLNYVESAFSLSKHTLTSRLAKGGADADAGARGRHADTGNSVIRCPHGSWDSAPRPAAGLLRSDVMQKVDADRDRSAICN
eukprot:IDg16879t1